WRRFRQCILGRFFVLKGIAQRQPGRHGRDRNHLAPPHATAEKAAQNALSVPAPGASEPPGLTSAMVWGSGATSPLLWFAKGHDPGLMETLSRLWNSWTHIRRRPSTLSGRASNIGNRKRMKTH